MDLKRPLGESLAVSGRWCKGDGDVVATSPLEVAGACLNRSGKEDMMI